MRRLPCDEFCMYAKTSRDGSPELSKLLLSATGGFMSSSMAVMLSPPAAPTERQRRGPAAESGLPFDLKHLPPLDNVILSGRESLCLSAGMPPDTVFLLYAEASRKDLERGPAPHRVQQDFHWRVNKVRLACPRTVNWPCLVQRRAAAGTALGRRSRRGGRHEQLKRSSGPPLASFG